MPIYEYRCEKGHSFEVMQSMADGTLTECTVCGAPVQRVFHPVAVHFKGTGFYTTDYGRNKSADDKPESGTAESGTDTKPAKAGSDSKSGESGSNSSSNTSDGASAKGGSKSSTKSPAKD